MIRLYKISLLLQMAVVTLQPLSSPGLCFRHGQAEAQTSIKPKPAVSTHSSFPASILNPSRPCTVRSSASESGQVHENITRICMSKSR